MTGKRFTSEHDQPGQDGLLNKEMDRRSFLGKTTKMAGVALGASLLGPLNALPADAASRSSIMNSNGAKPDLVFPVISDLNIYNDNYKNLKKFLKFKKHKNIKIYKKHIKTYILYVKNFLRLNI